MKSVIPTKASNARPTRHPDQSEQRDKNVILTEGSDATEWKDLGQLREAKPVPIPSLCIQNPSS